MAFRMMYGDICKMKVDCIVNSLGTNSRIMGAVCRRVAERANSKDIDKIISENIHGEYFDISITDAGSLPSKCVIHIVTPNKIDDDENLTLLTKAYDLVIKKAISLGYTSIAMPYLGTGANGYSISDIYKISHTIGESYVDENSPIDIKLVFYYRQRPKARTKEEGYSHLFDAITRETDKYDRLLEDTPDEIASQKNIESMYMKKKMKLSIQMNKLFALMDEGEMLNPEGDINCPMDFIYEVLEQKHLKKKFLFSRFMSKDDCSRVKRGRKKLTKAQIYKASIVLGLNRTQFLQLMGFANYSFNPNSELDVWFYRYYKKNIIEYDMGSFQEKYDADLNILSKVYD